MKMLPSSYIPASEDASKSSAASGKGNCSGRKSEKMGGIVVFLDKKDHVILTWTNVFRVTTTQQERDESKITLIQAILQNHSP